FLPQAMSGEKPVVQQTEMLDYDVNKARAQLAEAGYPNGEGFPVIRLLVNRNEQQRTVAQSIAEMWRAGLNIETEILIRDWEAFEASSRGGDCDVVRRGIVLQTTDETTNMRMLFERDSHLMMPRAKETEGPVSAATPEPVPAVTFVESEAQALK